MKLTEKHRSNANATRISIWGMMEMVKDPALLKAVRNQVLEKCLRVDAVTGARSLDALKMLEIRLLQSLSTEILRLHISVDVTREVVDRLSLGAYSPEKGDVLRAPSQLTHHDEEVWGDEGHRAWAEHHISYNEAVNASGEVIKQAEFSMTDRAGALFPYGECMCSRGPSRSRFAVSLEEARVVDPDVCRQSRKRPYAER